MYMTSKIQKTLSKLILNLGGMQSIDTLILDTTVDY